MRVSTRHQIVIGCAAALLILTLLSQIAYRTADAVGENNELITRAQSVLLYSENLSAQLDRLDQGVRQMAETIGLQSGDDYRTGRSVLRENLELLESFASADSSHRVHFIAIAELLDSKLTSLEAVMESETTDVPAVMVALDVSEDLTSRLHAEIRQLQRVELEALTSATVGNSFEASKAKYSILLVSIGAVVLLVIGTVLMLGDLRAHRRKEASVRKSEARFRQLAATAPVGIFVTGPRGEIEFLNDRYTAVTGRISEEVLGRPWTEGLHPHDRRKVTSAWERALANGDDFESEYRSSWPDGRVAWMHSRIAALRDNEGSVSGFIGTVTDMTEYKQTETERDRFFESSQDLLAIVDFKGRLHRFNPACSDKLGFTEAQLGALPLADLVHANDREVTEKAWTRLTSGGAITRFQNRVRTVNGSYRRLSWNAAADMDQQLVYAIARDITDSPRSLLEATVHKMSSTLVERGRLSHNLLVVEPLTPLAESIVEMLEENTLNSRVVTSGTEAMELATTDFFDAIILDMSLPDIDGKQLLQAIRDSPMNGATPVIAIISASDRRTIPDLHIQGFVEKPVDLRHLNEALWRAGVSPGQARNLRSDHEETPEIA